MTFLFMQIEDWNFTKLLIKHSIYQFNYSNGTLTLFRPIKLRVLTLDIKFFPLVSATFFIFLTKFWSLQLLILLVCFFFVFLLAKCPGFFNWSGLGDVRRVLISCYKFDAIWRHPIDHFFFIMASGHILPKRIFLFLLCFWINGIK